MLKLRQEEHDAERAATGQATVAANEVVNICKACETEDASNQTWGNFVEWLSHPDSKRGQEHFDGLFKSRAHDATMNKVETQVGRILDLWVTQNSTTGKADANSVSREAVLLTRADGVTDSYLQSFQLSSVHEHIRALYPSTTELLRQLTTTRCQRKQAENPPMTTQEQENAQKCERISSAMTILLGECSQRNSLVKNVLGLYLYATGSQRQAISILSSLGVSASYPSIAGKGKVAKLIGSASASGAQAPNLVLALLARGIGLLRCLSESCHASTQKCAQCNICGHVYDNINMENSTCATIFPLHDANPHNMQTSALLDSIEKAPPLSIDNICHTKEEAALFQQSLEHTLLRTILNACLPATDDQMPLRQTEIHPLPAMNIDESSTTGNSELGYPVGTTKFMGITHLMFGDQLSISHLRTLIANCAGHETLSDLYANVMATHWGDASAGFHNPASLSFFNMTLEDYAAELSFDKLKADVAEPTDPPFDPLATPLNVGDMVFENTSLFLRNVLILREFTDMIKGGYSGRIIRTLKILALMYCSSRWTKYAHELLHLVHNLTHVWPQGLCQVMINNWLVNLTGKPDHMNFWIKVIYKANSSNVLWEWLQTVSPCIDVLRKLALQMNTTLGAWLGTKHKSPSLDKDLVALQNSMQEHNIF
ncbi:hypothetical protein LXA43DRAFT_973118 [Ganoderma leucocontextum]|nr:hypothetical protein LXA43DRAFT_973118 [Ganoderma leucocontextum]